MRVDAGSFADRKVGRLAVDRPAGGREDQLAGPGAAARLRDVDRAENVEARVEQRVGDADPYVDLRGEVADDFGLRRGDDVDEPRFGHVGAGERERTGALAVDPARLGEVAQRAAGQVVDADHVVAFREQPVYQRRADEPGRARHQYPHERSLRDVERKTTGWRRPVSRRRGYAA